MKIFKLLFRLVYFLLAAFLIVNLAWLFGHRIVDAAPSTWLQEIPPNLAESPLIGNDSLFALSLISWFDRFFPKVPLWYPLQGMGVSLFHSYPMGTTFLVIIIHRLLGLTQVQAFRLVSFSTFVIAPLGIYFLAWNRVKSQTAGLLAGIFFLLSQSSWLFQTKHGIFAQSFSICLVPWVLLFYFLFLDSTLKKESLLKRRIWLFCSSLSFGILFLFHVVAGLVTLLALGCFSFFSSLIRKWRGEKPRLGERAFLFLLVSLLGLGIASFWVIPFRHYNALANREGLLTSNIEQLKEISLRPQTLLGLAPLGQDIHRYDFFFFASPVLILAAIGVLLAVLQKGKILALGVAAIVLALYTSAAIYLPSLVSLFLYFYTATYFRALIPAIVLFPVVAAFGAVAFSSLVLRVPAKVASLAFNPKRGLGLAIKKGFRAILVSFLSIGLSTLLVIKINNEPPVLPEHLEREAAYGLHRFKPYGPSLAQDLEVLKRGIDYAKNHWPKFVLSPQGGRIEEMVEKIVDTYNLSSTTRIDISPFALGGNFLQEANIYTDTPFVTLYHYSASIIHAMWGYQQGVFYGQEPLYKNPKLLEELTKYFGVNLAIIEPGFDDVEKYKAAGWEPVGRIDKGPQYKENVWRFPNPTGIFSLSAKPVVLVIGDWQKGAYETIFRIANLGIIPFDKAILVEGTKSINDYTLSELKKFSGIILHGYSYKGNAWKTIEEYVKEGGKVFVDTGWQYVAKDWGRGDEGGFYPLELPEPFPAKKTLWQSLGKEWTGVKIEGFEKIEPGQFGHLNWRGDPWWLAAAEREDLREGSRVILSKDNKVLIVERDYGEGKIIWSGMNLPTHLWTYQAEEEIEFTRQLFEKFFLGEEVLEDNNSLVSLKRDFPDKIEFSFEKTDTPLWFLWRESFSSNWRARIQKTEDGRQKIEKLKIYRNGPGLQLIRLPEVKNGGKLMLSYSLGLRGFVAKTVSLLSLLFLFYLLFEGIRGKSILEEKVLSRIKRKGGVFGEKIKKQWSDEEY